MAVLYLLIWGFVVLAGLTAVYGLVWSVRHGQLRGSAQSALSIFDEDEPPGRVTDSFPPPAGSSGRRIDEHQ